MKKCLIRNDFFDFSFRELCGVNLLSNISPIVVNMKNEEIEIPNDSLRLLTDSNNFNEMSPLEIGSDSCKIIFDAKAIIEADRILISGYYNGESDLGLSNYEIYISDTIDELFDRKNCVVEYNNSSCWKPDEHRNGCDQIFDIEDYKGRFFAIKINQSNPIDSIIRITHIGVYNHEHTEQITFCKNNFGGNVLRGKIPTAKGTYTADLSCLTDDVCFDESTRITLDTETSYTFKLDSEIVADSFYLIGSDEVINSCKIFVSIGKDGLLDNAEGLQISTFPKPTSHKGVYSAICMLDEPVCFSYIEFRFDGKGFIDELGILPFELSEE